MADDRKRWSVAEIDAAEPRPLPPPPEGGGPHLWIPLRQELDATAFGLNVWIGRDVGDMVIHPHDELWEGEHQHEEVYVMLRGRAEWGLDDEVLELSSGACIRVDAVCRRSAKVLEPDTVVIAIGAEPGVVYEPKQWELSMSESPKEP